MDPAFLMGGGGPKHEKTLNKFVKNLKIINKMGTSQLQEVGGGGGMGSGHL